MAALWIFGGKNGASVCQPFLAVAIYAAGITDVPSLLASGQQAMELFALVAVSFLAAGLAAVAFRALRHELSCMPSLPPTSSSTTKPGTSTRSNSAGGFVSIDRAADGGGPRSKLALYLAEGFGAFLLALGFVASQGYGGATASASFGDAGKSSGTAAGMDIGSLYICLTSALAYISGSSFNPAISLAFVLQGPRELRLRGLERVDCVRAMLVQVAGVVLACTIFGALQPPSLRDAAPWKHPQEDWAHPEGDWRLPAVRAFVLNEKEFHNGRWWFSSCTEGESIVEELTGVLIFSFALVR